MIYDDGERTLCSCGRPSRRPLALTLSPPLPVPVSAPPPPLQELPFPPLTLIPTLPLPLMPMPPRASNGGGGGFINLVIVKNFILRKITLLITRGRVDMLSFQRSSEPPKIIPIALLISCACLCHYVNIGFRRNHRQRKINFAG